jgi:hypothetical protein
MTIIHHQEGNDFSYASPLRAANIISEESNNGRQSNKREEIRFNKNRRQHRNHHHQQQQQQQQQRESIIKTEENKHIPIPIEDKIPLVIKTRHLSPSKSNPIPGIYGHCMCIRHETNTLYVYGGWVQNAARTDTLLSLDLNQLNDKNIKSVEWKIIEQKGSVKPGPCSFASLVELSGKLILFGGYFQNSWVNDMWSFDLDTCEWTKVEYKGNQIIPPRAAHSCNITRSKTEMIVHAGFDGTKVLNDLWLFSFISHEWKELQNNNPYCTIESTTCHSAVLSYDERRLIKFGGWDRTQYFNSLYEYDLEKNEWREIKPSNGFVPNQRWSHVSFMLKSMTDMEDKLMVMFGSSQSYFSDCYIFDFSTRLWTEVKFDPPLEAQNSMTGALTWNSKILLFGGRHKSEYINCLTELTVENVVPLSNFFTRLISKKYYELLMQKNFAVDVDLICTS